MNQQRLEGVGASRDRGGECPPAGLHTPPLPGDQGQVERMRTEAKGRPQEQMVSPGATLGPGWRSDNQVRFHCRWWLLGLAEA